MGRERTVRLSDLCSLDGVIVAHGNGLMASRETIVFFLDQYLNISGNHDSLFEGQDLN